jgi:hypothetical protein
MFSDVIWNTDLDNGNTYSYTADDLKVLIEPSGDTINTTFSVNSLIAL